MLAFFNGKDASCHIMLTERPHSTTMRTDIISIVNKQG